MSYETSTIHEYETNSSRMTPTATCQHERVVVEVTVREDTGEEEEHERCLECGRSEGPF